jgi:hypothetical protein
MRVSQFDWGAFHDFQGRMPDAFSRHAARLALSLSIIIDIFQNETRLYSLIGHDRVPVV